jgi:hypothetical protein
MKKGFSYLVLSFQILLRRPFVFLALHIPDAFAEILSDLLMKVPALEGNYGLVAVFFAFYWFSSCFCLASSFVAVGNQIQSKPFSVLSAWRAAFQRIGSLFFTSIATCVAVALGLLAVLPGFYFLAVFVWTPLLVMDRPPMKWTHYLWESKQVTKTRFWSVLSFIVLSVVASFFVSQAESSMSVQWERFFPGPTPIKRITTGILGVFIDTTFMALVNVFLCVWYLKREEAQPPSLSESRP